MLKKVLALALAGAMVIGSMSLSAFGAAGDSAMTADTSLKISGLMPGDTVKFYKVVGWVGDNTVTTERAWGGWAVNDGFSDVIDTSDKLGSIIDSRKTSETGTAYQGITSEIAGDLSRSDGVDDANLVATETVAANKDYVVASGVEPGLYMAIITPDDVNTVYNPVFVSADWFQSSTPDTSEWIVTSERSYSDVNSAQGAAKKTTLEVNKESDGYENELDTDNSDPGDTVKPGDVLDFTVTTTIPGYGLTFDHPRFVLKDTMDTLTYNEDIEIKAGSTTLNGTELASGADLDTVLADETTTYDYIIVESGEEGYKISFTEKYLKGLATPTAIEAKYTATVNELDEGTYENIVKEQNTVEIEYSHNPSTEEDGKPGGDRKYKKDITNHYTFSIDANNIGGKPGAIGESMTEIIKVAVDREGNPIYSENVVQSNITETSAVKSPLEGCVFELKKINDDTDGNDPQVVKTATSDENGRLLFEGLDEGEYELREISAPSGWVRDTTTHTIVIDAELQEKEYTEYYDQAGNWYAENAEGRTAFTYKADELVSYKITFDGHPISEQKFEHKPSGSSEIVWSSNGSRELPSSIHNTQGVELPSTGGIGTTIFYAGGAMLVLLAGVLLVSKRRAA